MRKERAQETAQVAVFLGGSVFAILALYVALGGDHFGMFRFYQPLLPILPLPFLVMALSSKRSRYLASVNGSLSAGIACCATLYFVLIGVSYLATDSKGSITREIDIARSGRLLGTELNELALETKPFSIAVIPAGGIALTFTGKIYDLMGLNWRDMAHSNRVKTGARNHGSFDKAVFWGARPDFVAPSSASSVNTGFIVVSPFEQLVLKGLSADPKFQAEYAIAQFRISDRVVKAYVSNAWLQQTGVVPASVTPWDRVIFETGEWSEW